ncbi:MAG: 4'-phosphopantetheinyl transferase family protein, partial [Planctomycetota bacterium]
MPNPLPENEVHVWYCFCDDPGVAVQEDRYRRLLAAEEVARYERFAFDQDRRRFLVARGLLRTTLSRYVSVDPAAWRFERTGTGKPFLAMDAGVPPLQFNVSHSQQLAVCAVTLNRRVGVDVESTTRLASQRVVKYVLSEHELSHFSNTTGESRRQLFYRYWTLKEAYAKALGIGLSLRFNEFSFHLAEPDPPTIGRNPSAPASDWKFHQQKVAPHYWLAVAVECPSGNRPLF